MNRVFHWFIYMPRRPLHGEQTRLHALKWWLIKVLRFYEFKVTCDCGNKIKATDGLRDAEYTCLVCSAVWVAKNKRVFT